MKSLALASSLLVGTLSFLLASQTLAGDEVPPKRVDKTVQLFNGKDLAGWTTWLVDKKREDPRGVYSVRDAMVRISGEGFGYLATERTYRDYHLVVEFRWGERNWGDRRGKARDSGVFLHAGGPDGNSFDGNGAYKAAIECQVMEGAVGDLLLIRGRDRQGRDVPLQATAAVRQKRDADDWPYWSPDGRPQTLRRWGRINWQNKDAGWQDTFGFRGKDDLENKPGEWTRLECVCAGNRIRVLVNGAPVNEVRDVSPAAGQILLQCEGSEVFFRRVELRPLPAQEFHDSSDVGGSD